MNYKNLIYTKEEGIATLTFNRPEVLNALTWEMVDEIEGVSEEVKKDEEVKVLVVTGTGRAFCAGWDVHAPFERPEQVRFAHCKWVVEGSGPPFFYSIPKPVIAAVNGPVVGMGHELALMCDIRIASERARFGDLFIRRGLISDCGAGPYFLPRLVGLSKACELIFTGDIIDAKEAERIGLVSQVVPHDELMSVTMELATKIAKMPPIAIKFAKQLIHDGLKMDYEHLWQVADSVMGILYGTEDYKEGVQSFIEKREPVFKGR